MSKTLTAGAVVAVGKAIKDAALKAAASEVKPGTYNVDVTVHVTGEYTVGNSYEQRVVAKAKPWTILAVALNELNKAREAAGEAGLDMEKLITMAETVNPDLAEQAEAAAAEAIQKVKAPTIQTCNGKITTNLAVEVVDEKVNAK